MWSQAPCTVHAHLQGINAPKGVSLYTSVPCSAASTSCISWPGWSPRPGRYSPAGPATGPPPSARLHGSTLDQAQRPTLRGRASCGQRGDSLVKVMLKPLFPVEWSVWNSRRATWPLLVMEEGSWFPEKVPRTGASAVAPSLMTRKSNWGSTSMSLKARWIRLSGRARMSQTQWRWLP